MNGLQRLPQNEEAVIVGLVREHGLQTSRLHCEYTRQQDTGVGRSRSGREYGVSYDLMLCKFCGNLEGSRNNTPYCPDKLRVLKARMLEA